MEQFVIGGLPNDLIAGNEKHFRRIQVDVAQTGFFEGTEFRAVRKLSVSAGTPLVWKFTCAVDFILHEQFLGVSVGDIEYFAWRSADAAPSGTFNQNIPVRGKNISAEFRPHTSGLRYVSQTTINYGGAVTPPDANQYVDYDRAKTSNATAQQLTVGGAKDSVRYLSAGDFYLQFISTTGTSEGRFSLAWEERPTWPS